MTARRRFPRRQGVVYGPLVSRDPPPTGSVLGRVLGAIVVFGALAVLAIGGLAVLGGNASPSASASPTAAAPASSSPRTSALPTLTTTPSPSPTPLATPTPSPTPFPVVLLEGPGKITFASNYTSDFELVDPHVDFALGDSIAWRANIGQPVGQDRIDFDVRQVNTTTLEEVVVHTASFRPRNADSVEFFVRSQVSKYADGPGIFVMRYYHNGTVISEGYFRVI